MDRGDGTLNSTALRDAKSFLARTRALTASAAAASIDSLALAVSGASHDDRRFLWGAFFPVRLVGGVGSSTRTLTLWEAGDA